MHYLVDTYNLVHASTGMGGSIGDMSVRKLCQFIAASPLRATLILDGRAKPDEPGENEFPDIKLVYSGAGVPADLVIGQIVERSKERKKLMVVTNDRAVALQARRWFANAMSCESFLRELSGNPGPGTGQRPEQKRSGGGSPGEVDHWLEEFGLKSMPGQTKSTDQRKEEDPGLGGLNIEDLLGPPGG